MKLLLTSAGITNQLIADTLSDLVGKLPSDIKIGFIPMAKNVEINNATWLVKKLSQMFEFGFTDVELVDPSANDTNWQTRLAEKDVILVGGGNTFHLLNQMRITGFDGWLQSNLGNKVYVGISAGSIVATPNIAIASVGDGDENIPGINDLTGLSFVSFEVSPHSPESVTHEENQAYANLITNQLYAYDDNSALRIDGANIKVISESVWEKFND